MQLGRWNIGMDHCHCWLPSALYPSPPGQRRQFLQGSSLSFIYNFYESMTNKVLVIFLIEFFFGELKLLLLSRVCYLMQDRLWESIDEQWMDCLRKESLECLIQIPSGFVQVLAFSVSLMSNLPLSGYFYSYYDIIFTIINGYLLVTIFFVLLYCLLCNKWWLTVLIHLFLLKSNWPTALKEFICTLRSLVLPQDPHKLRSVLTLPLFKTLLVH